MKFRRQSTTSLLWNAQQGGSRKKSNAGTPLGSPGPGSGGAGGGGFFSSANSSSNMFANCTPANSSPHIAAAIAQAVAFAKNSGGGNYSPHNINNGNNIPDLGGSASYHGSKRSNFAGPGEISASVKNNAPFSSKYNSSSDWGHQHDFEQDEEGNSQDFMPTMAMARKSSQASLTRDTSLKLLNKAKISYREVMEG